MIPASEQLAGKPTRPETGSASPRILIVEDEALLCWSLANALRKVGYEVTIAEAGEKAVEKAEAGSFDVVITDLKLPHLSGIQVAAAVKKNRPDTSVVMMSALDERERGEPNGTPLVDAFIEKPFDLHEMTRLVEKLLARRRSSGN